MERISKFVLPILMLLFAGCQTITYDALLFDGVASMNRGSLPDGYTVVGQFNYTTRASFTAYDLITLHDPDMIAEMNKSLKVNGGDAVINLSIEEVNNVVDVLIGMFVSTVSTAAFKTSINIFSTRTVEIKGDVVKYKNASLPDSSSLKMGNVLQKKILRTNAEISYLPKKH
ncbi:MAG: hypothetical protein WDA22_16340 [Bacteroidota bacterium]